MKTVYWQQYSEQEQQQLLTRPAITDGAAIKAKVAQVINSVRETGDRFI